MKRILLLFALATIIANAYTQVAISTNGSSPNVSAMLDVVSTEKGLLIPRMIMAERDVIDLPADGLLIYQTDNTPGFYFYNGSSWEIVASGIMEINNLIDGKTGGNCVFLGSGAGANNAEIYNENVALGVDALNMNTSGYWNTASGYQSLYHNTAGDNNIGIGKGANYYNQEGNNNTIIGYGAGKGTTLHNKSGNIFLGYYAGYNEVGDNKLYIENSTSTFPLIYGEFDNNLLRVNGTLDINDSYQFPTTDGSSGQVLQTNGSGILSWNNDVGATQINDLSDGRTVGYSVFLGSGAGTMDNGTNNYNVAVGIDALKYNISGYWNTATGFRALYSNETGEDNTANGCHALYSNETGNYNTANGSRALYCNITGSNNTANGCYALYSNATGNYNTANGSRALYYNTTGSNNTANGNHALDCNTTGNYNTVIGSNANSLNQEGSNNTIIGYSAGMGSGIHNKSGNVFLGYRAGDNEMGDNKLYIENSNSSSPLIYGEFDNNLMTVFGNLGVGTKEFGGGARTLSLENSTVPTSSNTNGVLLYSQDVSFSSELRVRDEAGNITTLSPHNFSMTNKSEPMAWSYYSENTAIDKKINVDMLKAVRLIEKLTGEKLAFVENIEDDTDNIIIEENSFGIVQQQQKQIDNLMKLNDELIKRIEKLEEK